MHPGSVHAVVQLTGTSMPHWRIDLRWNDLLPSAHAVALVRIGAHVVRIVMPIP